MPDGRALPSQEALRAAAETGGEEAWRRYRFIVQIAIYPTLMLGPMLLLWALLERGVPLLWAPYAAVLAGAPLVLIAERLLPYRSEWRPSLAEFRDDGLYMFAVQILLPLGLAWLTALAAQSWLSGVGFNLGLWPTLWPLWAQLAAKIVIGDFFRYWLHRAAHSWPPLWRLHTVHHAPEKLYTTSVFRFHPIEKVLQFLCDSLPFILVGVGPELLGYYFVFYAMSGLFQHSNCDIRLGWLNYLVSGPEVHRWHHSRKIVESNANYAHSFVVWDLILGTYYRPRGETVDKLGLLNRGYPSGFWRQLAAPFQPWLRP
ncbi:MAG TPA: sterol desaturase family protein [Alphaproteobacteria bacterium]|nr:sterol desaturase family protein [Alphaproteobacteria bacterium]